MGGWTPRSARAIGRIRTDTIRPVPGCAGRARGTAEPVRMKLPGSAPRSTAVRTASQTSGTSCHSSMRTGRGPARAAAGSASVAMRVARSARSCTVRARSAAVRVLPTARGPSRATAAAPARWSSSSSSTSCRRYGRMADPPGLPRRACTARVWQPSTGPLRDVQQDRLAPISGTIPRVRGGWCGSNRRVQEALADHPGLGAIGTLTIMVASAGSEPIRVGECDFDGDRTQQPYTCPRSEGLVRRSLGAAVTGEAPVVAGSSPVGPAACAAARRHGAAAGAPPAASGTARDAGHPPPDRPRQAQASETRVPQGPL